MKTLLIIALVISNGVWLAVCFRAKQGEPRTVCLPASQEQPSQAAAIQEKTQNKSAPAALRSSWSELESEEYAIFIQNLRSFGCPDATINHIVEGELREMQEERNPLQVILTSQLRKTDPRRVQAEEKLRQLDQINNRIISQLLTGSTQPTAALMESPNKDQTMSKNTAHRASSVKMPLVMSGVTLQVGNPPSASSGGTVQASASGPGPGVLVTTPEQAATIQKLQQSFINAVGGTNQDPADPNYLKHWQDAQPDIDQMYYTLYGQDAYYQYQKAAATKAYAESLAGK